MEESSGGERQSGLLPDMDNMNLSNVNPFRLITADNNLLEIESMNTRGEVSVSKMNDRINLMSYIMKLLPTRLQKPCADMLLMWK